MITSGTRFGDKITSAAQPSSNTDQLTARFSENLTPDVGQGWSRLSSRTTVHDATLQLSWCTRQCIELPWCTLQWYGTAPELYYSEWCYPGAHYSGVELLCNYPGAHDSAWSYPGAHYSGMVLHRNYITVNGATQVHTTAAWSYSGTTLVHAAVHGATLELPWCTLQCMVLLWCALYCMELLWCTHYSGMELLWCTLQ